MNNKFNIELGYLERTNIKNLVGLNLYFSETEDLNNFFTEAAKDFNLERVTMYIFFDHVNKIVLYSIGEEDADYLDKEYVTVRGIHLHNDDDDPDYYDLEYSGVTSDVPENHSRIKIYQTFPLFKYLCTNYKEDFINLLREFTAEGILS